MKWFKGFSFVVVVGFMTVGCTPGEKEKIIIQERQAPVNLSESIQLANDESQLILQKSALGKAFLLTPSLVISKRTPDFNDFKPQIVSFERSGSRVGLFRLSNNNLYNSIPTDKLLQSFRIVKETPETITIDISQGFRNLPFEEHLSIVEKEAVNNSASGSEGLETTVDIKEALIRKSEVSGNIMYIEQAVRIGSIVKATEDKKEEGLELIKPEMTAKVIIEIKPYVESKTFKKQLFDKEQRVGYFINFAFLSEEEQVLPQITKWDFSEERGVITVALEENIPQEILAATEEGITYWNRVYGREVLKVRHGFKATDRVSDRMIVVRWVKWESAGFAYASMQADPLTGEILRAQIFMTSSWLKSPKEAAQFPIAQKAGLCVLEQSKMNIAKTYVNLSAARKQALAQDVIRTVVAHEMGHVMGLRHNFAGSLNHEGTDQDLIKAQAEYLTNENHSGYAFSSTVMDYEGMLHTGLIGAFIKHSTLPYDRAAMGWGYKDEAINLAAASYCSDEHIMLANNQGADIYGCERFDAFKNPTLGAAHLVKSNIDNTVASTFASVIRAKAAHDPYSENRPFMDAASVYFYLNLEQLETILFTEKDKLTLLSPLMVINTFKANLSAESKVAYDSEVTSKLQSDLTAIGGLTGVLNLFLDLEKNNPEDLHILENQTSDFFAKLNPSADLSESEYKQVVASMTASVKNVDKTLLAKVMAKFVPVYTGNYRYKTREEYNDAQKNPEKYKAPTMRFRDDVVLGDAKLLMSLFRKAILAGKDAPKKVVINGQELQVQTLGYSNYDRETLSKAFVLENWPVRKQAEIRQALNEELALLKAEIAANTVAVLKALGQPVPEPLTYAELYKAINAVSFSQVSGLYSYELIAYDLAVLDKIEKAKPE